MTATLPAPTSLARLLQRAVASVDAAPVVAPERRSAPRVACAVRVECRHQEASFAARTRDLSSTGLSLVTDRGFDLGEILELHVALVGGPTVDCVGLVRWSLPDAVGLEFHKLRPADRRALADWVRRTRSLGSGEARRRWSGRSDVGEATYDAAGRTLRWRIPFATLWRDLVPTFLIDATMFVPARSQDVREGERITVEIVPPECHAVLRLFSEVTWVDADGVGIRHAGLTEVDRSVLAAVSAHFEREAGRYG